MKVTQKLFDTDILLEQIAHMADTNGTGMYRKAQLVEKESNDSLKPRRKQHLSVPHLLLNPSRRTSPVIEPMKRSSQTRIATKKSVERGSWKTEIAVQKAKIKNRT